MQHTAEFRRCLLELDVPGMRKLWRHVSPHLPQPATDDEALTTMHIARTKMLTLPEADRLYSEAWLIERKTTRDVFAVGVIVGAANSQEPHRRRRGVFVQQEMVYSVQQSLSWGIGIDNPKDAAEVKRRMMLARERA